MSTPPFKRHWPLVALALLALTILLWWQHRPTPPPVFALPVPQRATESVPAPPPISPPISPPATGPEVRLNAALAIPDPRQRAQEFGLMLQQLIQRDVDAALAYVRQMPHGSEYSQALFMVLDAVSRRDPDRALALARELITTREESSFYSALFDRLARENLPTATQRLAAVPSGDARDNAIRALVDVWVRVDQPGALAWARQLAEANDRTIAIETVLNELSSRNPVAAVELAQKTLSHPALGRAISRAVQILTISDPEKASTLVNLIPPGDLQTGAVVTVARALAAQNIDRAVAWVNTISIDLTQWMALNAVLTLWAQKDPTAAARYVLEMPTGQGQEFAASQLASSLAANPREAIAWAEALPTEGARASAFNIIASTWAQRAPAEAVRWAASLREPPQLANAVTGAYSYWMLLDPAAARAWLETADLPAETKAQLLRR